MSVRVHHYPEGEVDIQGGGFIYVPDTWIVAAGEYADEGEPDIVVTISHAINVNGDDIRQFVAQQVAKAIERIVAAGGDDE